MVQMGKTILYSGHPPNVPMGHGPDDSRIGYPPNVPTGHVAESQSLHKVRGLREGRGETLKPIKSQNGLEELQSPGTTSIF